MKRIYSRASPARALRETDLSARIDPGRSFEDPPITLFRTRLDSVEVALRSDFGARAEPKVTLQSRRGY